MRWSRAFFVAGLTCSFMAPGASRAQLAGDSSATVVRVRLTTTPVARGLVIGFLERQTADSLWISLNDRNTRLAIPRAAVAQMDLYRGRLPRVGGLVGGVVGGAIGGALVSVVALTALRGDTSADKWRAGRRILFGSSIAGGVVGFLVPPPRWQRLER